MTLSIPKLSLVVLIGPSGSGKSTFAAKHFLPTEVLSSDACRGMVSDDPNDQTATNDAFEILHFVAAKRLALGRLTVVDATNVQTEIYAGGIHLGVSDRSRLPGHRGVAGLSFHPERPRPSTSEAV